MFNIDKHLTFPRALFLTSRFIKNSSLSKDKVKKMQFEKLKKLLIHSYENISFYRERMDSVDFSPYSFSNLAEFQKIPELTKSEYKSYVQKEISKNPDKFDGWYKDGTSGSTGQPLKVYRTWEERSYMIAKWLKPMFLNGYSFFHRTYSLPSPHRNVKRDSWIQALGIGRRYTVPYTDTVENMIKGYQEAKPDFFYANKSQIVQMAQEIIDKGIAIKKPRYYAVTSETLDDNSKKLIQSVFGRSNMFEEYGAVELGGVLAYQLKGKEGLEFCYDTEYLELDNDGVINMEKGNCVVTDLHIRSFPLIRYRLGDWVEMEPGKEKEFPRIKKIRGREDDWILLPNGRKIPFHPFYEIMEKRTEVNQFRVIQKSREDVEVQIALEEGVNKEYLEKEILQELKQEISPQLNFELQFLKQILPDPNGKLRMLVNKVINN